MQVTDKMFHMDNQLKDNIDIIGKKVVEDWDWVLLVTGSGKVRVGKSVIGMQVAYYLSKMHNTPFSVKGNIVFNSADLIKRAKELPKYSVLVYDEAREGLEARKSAEKLARNLLDFFAECGQLNLFIIIIMPDFFELKRNIAITRSVALINVYYGEMFKRGFFSFYNDEAKKLLYLKGKQYLNYLAHKPDFRGTFSNYYPINEAEYREAKSNALLGSKKEYKTEDQIVMEEQNKRIRMMVKLGYTYEKIGEVFELAKSTINQRLFGVHGSHNTIISYKSIEGAETPSEQDDI